MANKFEIIGEFNDKDIKRAFKNTDKQLGKTQKNAKGLTSGFKKMGVAIVSSFAVGAIAQFGRKIAETRGQFQKLQAVLENTLGSKSGAQQAFKVLNQLAQKSNFGLLELTDSYVKLVNQGINPTRAEMVKLQDLANSTGKSFDQLSEAIIDGMVGENERLKEFGIRAQKSGEKTIFTFKGVKTEVDNTTEAITKYLIGLGDLQGVAGATDKISQTLAGRLSNVGDAMDTAFNQIGESLEPQLNSSIDLLLEMLSILPAIVKEFVALTDDASQFFGESKDGIKIVNAGFWVLNGILNTVIASVRSLFELFRGGFLAWQLFTSGVTEQILPVITEALSRVKETWTNDFNQMGALYERILDRMATSNKKYSKGFKKINQSNVDVVKATERNIRAEGIATSLSRARSAKEFTGMAIDMAIDRAIASFIEDAISKFGWAGIPLAAGAGAVARSLFSGIGKFAEGGLIGGNSFSGDRQLILANSGERVLNIPQQEFLLKAGGMGSEKMDILIAQNEQLLDALTFRDEQTVNTTISSVALVDLYNDGQKNKGLLSSG